MATATTPNGTSLVNKFPKLPTWEMEARKYGEGAGQWTDDAGRHDPDYLATYIIEVDDDYMEMFTDSEHAEIVKRLNDAYNRATADKLARHGQNRKIDI